MKAKWKDEEIIRLFSLVEENNKNNLSTMQSFKQFAEQNGKNPLSIRNFYYGYLKILRKDTALQKKLGIDISKHLTQVFEHFDKKQEEELIAKIAEYKSKGISTRNACMKLSNGDAKLMLRIQNKLRNMKYKSKIIDNDSIYKNYNVLENEKTKVIQFPNSNFSGRNGKLSDDDIKSLFMGLVKLVKENANADEKEKAEKFLEQTEEEKRKKIIELEQKQTEIESLKQQINELKIKNNTLNKQLEFYRIEYIQKIENLPNLW